MDSLTLDERFNAPSIFSVVHEYVNPNHLHHIKQQANRDTPLKNGYPSDYHFLDTYTYQWCSGLNCFVTEWHLKHGWGRIYPSSASMSTCHRPTRHTLCCDYIDFDMKNCQYEIVLDLMRKFGFKHESVAEYCRDPKHYQKTNSKQDFLTVLNGGFVDDPFLQAIKREVQPLAKAVRELNPHIQVPEKTSNSFFSYYLQSIERYLQESAVKEIVEKYQIPIHDIIPCQDGFMVRKIHYQDGMMPTGNWIVKPMKEAYEWEYTDVPYLPFDFGTFGDAEYATLLSHVNRFEDLVSTGQDKYLEAYQFDVFWRKLPMNNAIFQQGCFEKLRDWCTKKIILFRKATSTLVKDVPEEKVVRTRKAEFGKKQNLLEKQYETRRKTFEKEQALAYKEFMKRKQAYEKTEQEKYPKQFEKAEWTETFQKAEWTETDVETQLEQNDKWSQYIRSLCVQETKLKQLSMSKDRENILQILLKKVYVNSIEWNKDPYLFAFENCVFDIRAKKKVTPQRDQYINQSCGYAYDDQYDMSRIAELKILIASILPVESVRNYWLAKQSTMLTQEHPQYLFIQTGSGSNGKSIVTDLTSCMLGDYGYKLSSSFLQKTFKDGANPEVANLRNKRGVWCSEPQAEMRLCASTIKELTGDASINGRGLYQSNCDIRLTMTLSLDANSIPNIDLVEFAMERRLRPIPFTTTAVSQDEYNDATDKTLLVIKNSKYVSAPWKDQYKQALFEILMQQYSDFNFDDLPVECADRKLAYLNASSDIYSFVSELYEPCDPEACAPIKLKDIYEEFKGSSVFKAFKKGQQRELTYAKFSEKISAEPAFKKLVKLRKQYHNGVQLSTDCLIGFKILGESEAELMI